MNQLVDHQRLKIDLVGVDVRRIGFERHGVGRRGEPHGQGAVGGRAVRIGRIDRGGVDQLPQNDVRGKPSVGQRVGGRRVGVGQRPDIGRGDDVDFDRRVAEQLIRQPVAGGFQRHPKFRPHRRVVETGPDVGEVEVERDRQQPAVLESLQATEAAGRR